MKKIFIAIALLLISVITRAQDNRITAILDKEPANNATELNANAAAVAQLGEADIVDLLSMLQPTGQADNTKIFDAISGCSFYTTQPGREQWRALAVDHSSETF